MREKKKLAEVRKCFGMEMNVEKTKIKRLSTQPSPVQIMMKKKWRMWNSSTVWVA